MENFRQKMESARATSSQAPQEVPIFPQFNSSSTTTKLLQEPMPRFGTSTSVERISESPLATAVSADAIPTPQTGSGPTFEEVRAAHAAASETVEEIARRCHDPANPLSESAAQKWREECFGLVVQNLCLQQELVKKQKNGTTNCAMAADEVHPGSGAETTKMLAALQMQQSSLMSVLDEFDKKCKVRLDSVSHRTRQLEENVQSTVSSLHLDKNSSNKDVADLVREAVWRQREASLAMENAANLREEELYILLF